jgi:hypothetical protein
LRGIRVQVRVRARDINLFHSDKIGHGVCVDSNPTGIEESFPGGIVAAVIKLSKK